MDGDQRRELESFLVQTEGAPPPVFVGRVGVLEDIALAAEQAWKGPGSGLHGMEKATRIVQGAPGAGKSSILNEITRSPERLRRKGVPVPMVVMLKSGDIEEPVDILEPLARRINSSAAGDFLSRYSRTIAGEAGVGLGPVRVGGRVETSAETARPRARWNLFGAWVEQNGGFDRPIVLTIDEAQRFDYERKHPIAKLFQSLHDGCGLPIVLVLAGLSDTEYSAGRMDLTRIPVGQVHNIGCFPDHEVGEFMARSCAHFGIDIAGFEQEVSRLAEPCEGWPRHLHIVLKALGSEALKTGNLGQVEWRTVFDNGRAGREAYYASQQSEQMEISARLTANVMSVLDIGINRPDVIDLIEKNIGEHPSDRLPTDIKTAEEFLIHLLHRGALQRDSRKLYTCPIPSFRAYLLEQGGMVQNHSQTLEPA